MSDLLAALTRALDRRFDVSLMRGAFETALGRIVPVRSVHLRENGNRWGGRAATHSPESVTLEVPGADAESQGLLEVAFDSDCRLGDWDFQMLGTAANLGALVLEIERSRTQLARAGLLNPNRVRRDGAAPLIGSTTVMCGLRAAIERVAATDFTILLEGESGVGKELVARQIHELSRRRNGPFVAINCAALVETLLEAELFGIEERTATGVRGRRGKFEAAEGGTLFLDEVSDLSLSAQAKLLRAIQDLAVERVGGQSVRRVDIRIVAATNRSLASLVEQRLFRPDLFYRLSGVDIRVPTLRERRPDILELARYFLERHRATRVAASVARRVRCADGLRLAGQCPRAGTADGACRRACRRRRHRARRPAARRPRRLRERHSGRRCGATTGCARGRADTRASCSTDARATSGKRAASLDISYHTLQSYLRYPVHDPFRVSGSDDPRNESPWRADEDEGARLEVETAV